MQLVDDELVFTARGVQIEMPAHNQLHTIVQIGLHLLGGTFPNCRLDARPIILQNEIAMTRRTVPAEVGHFARYPNQRKRLLDNFFQNVGKLRNRQHRQRRGACLNVDSHFEFLIQRTQMNTDENDEHRSAIMKEMSL